MRTKNIYQMPKEFDTINEIENRVEKLSIEARAILKYIKKWKTENARTN